MFYSVLFSTSSSGFIRVSYVIGTIRCPVLVQVPIVRKRRMLKGVPQSSHQRLAQLCAHLGGLRQRGGQSYDAFHLRLKMYQQSLWLLRFAKPYQERPVIIWLPFACHFLEKGQSFLSDVRPKCLEIVQQTRLLDFRLSE